MRKISFKIHILSNIILKVKALIKSLENISEIKTSHGRGDIRVVEKKCHVLFEWRFFTFFPKA